MVEPAVMFINGSDKLLFTARWQPGGSQVLGSSGGGEDMGKLIGLRQARLNTSRMVVGGIFENLII